MKVLQIFHPNTQVIMTVFDFRALQKADLVILLGARLNWILHFGKPPRFADNVKVIQVDICPEELNNNSNSCVGLHGDLKAVVGQVSSLMEICMR